MSDLPIQPRIAFTGHRPDKLGGYGNAMKHLEIAGALSVKLLELKPRLAVSGMALGVDQIAATVCVGLGIPFIAALICDHQEARWPQAAQHKFRALLLQASRIVTVSPGPYEDWKPEARNEAMLRSCDVVVAVWNGSKGGTYSAVQSAKQRRLPIHRLDPDTMVWSFIPARAAK